MLLASIALLLVALLGHGMLSVGLLNRMHAVPLSRPLIKLLSLGIYAFGAGVPVLIVAWAVYYDVQPRSPWPASDVPCASLVAAYLAIAVAAACVRLPQWLHWRLTARPPEQLLSNHGTRANLGATLGPAATNGLGRLYARVPGNQILHLETNEKALAVPRLPSALDGLSIAHLSDLHLTGWIDRCYFAEVVERVNAMRADLVMIAGDLVDNNHSIDTVCELLGQLRAPQGVYFVLGNHDRRVDHRRLRQLLASAGLIDLAARRVAMEVQGQRLILAGNELPWFPAGPDMNDRPETAEDQQATRIALCHTPDQIRWAQRHDFDLLLAGHTHGGQIRLPLLGPIVAPSYYGVRYASGTFYEPPTLMHVSRGVSGLQLVRWNCPPEITKLVLRSAAKMCTLC